MDTIPADLFFATATPGTRFRAWPTTGSSIYAGVILTATGTATRTDDSAIFVPFRWPAWTGLDDGAVYRGADDRYELVDADAVDVCGCGQPGTRHPDPYHLAVGVPADEVRKHLLLCPTCLVQVTDLAHAE